ncbi:MAG: hypothetical protein KKA79_00865 [Nanoarchaeota archaeon]|nr:hypothetical protein [Nanoarchaeota archaeon]
MRKEKKGIDEQIKPLIDIMNNSGWIKTFSSCEGHHGDEVFDEVYVGFYCKANKIKLLCKILNTIEKKLGKIPTMMKLFLQFSKEWPYGNQVEAPEGYLALELCFWKGDNRQYDNRRLLNVVTGCFRKGVKKKNIN